MVEYGGVLARTSGLEPKQHMFSAILGSTSLIASLVIKLMPKRITDFLVPKIDDSKITGES